MADIEEEFFDIQQNLLMNASMKLEEGDRDFAIACYVAVNSEIKEYFQTQLEEHTCDRFEDIIEIHKHLNDELEKYKINDIDIVESYFSNVILPLDLDQCTYVCLTPSSTFPETQDGCIKMFIIDAKLQVGQKQLGSRDLVLTIGSQLFTLSKDRTICYKQDGTCFTILTPCFNNENVIFTLIFHDDVNVEWLVGFEETLKNYCNIIEQSKDEHTIYELADGVDLELFKKPKYTDTSLKLYRDKDKTLILTVGDKLFPLSQSMRYLKPEARAILIKEEKDFEVLIRFPDTISNEDFMILEHIISEYNFGDVTEHFLPLFTTLLNSLNDLDLSKDEIDSPTLTSGQYSQWQQSSQFNWSDQASPDSSPWTSQYPTDRSKDFQSISYRPSYKFQKENTSDDCSISSNPNKSMVAKMSESFDVTANYAASKISSHSKRIVGLLKDPKFYGPLIKSCFDIRPGSIKTTLISMALENILQPIYHDLKEDSGELVNKYKEIWF